MVDYNRVVYMLEQKVENGEEFRSSCRRSRKDEEGRNYICGCGKKYLSYPALYTHIKTKHDGIQPQGTQKTANNGSFKRNKPKIDEELLKEILTLLQKKDLNILNELNEAEGSVPMGHRIRRDILPKEVYDYFNDQVVKLSSLKINQSSTVDLVLVCFLINVGEYVGENLYVFFLHFVKIIRKCFLEHGSQVYECAFKEKNKSLEGFTTNECRYLPIICDFMIRYYIPVDYAYIDTAIMQLILYDFCKWMWRIKLTQVLVLFKKPQQLKTAYKTLWRTLPKNTKLMGFKDQKNPDEDDEDALSNEQEGASDSQSNHPSDLMDEELLTKGKAANDNSIC